MVIAFVIHQSPVTNRRRRTTPTVILPSSYNHPTFLYLYIYSIFFSSKLNIFTRFSFIPTQTQNV